MENNAMRFQAKLFKVFFLLIFLPAFMHFTAFAQKSTVRLALVNVPDEVLRPMLPDFEKQTGVHAEIV